MLKNKKAWIYTFTSLALSCLAITVISSNGDASVVATAIAPRAAAIEIDESYDSQVHKSITVSLDEPKSAAEIEQEKLESYYESISDEIVERNGDAIFTYNPFIMSNLSVEQYNKILEGTKLEGFGEFYYDMELRHEVNGLFAVSVACLESGYGKYRANINNYYGMKNADGWMEFDSPEENIQYFGRLMNKPLYFGKNIYEIGDIYCPSGDNYWATSVRSIMRSNFEKLGE